MLVLPRPLSLPEKSTVRVTIESGPERDVAFDGLLDKTRRNQVLIAQIKEANAKEMKFEDVVKSAEQAAVSVLV